MPIGYVTVSGAIPSAIMQAQQQMLAAARQTDEYIQSRQAQAQLSASVDPAYMSSLLQQVPAPRINDWYHRQRASECVGEAERLIERIAFWSEMPLSDRIVVRLTDRLEAKTDQIERWLA